MLERFGRNLSSETAKCTAQRRVEDLRGSMEIPKSVEVAALIEAALKYNITEQTVCEVQTHEADARSRYAFADVLKAVRALGTGADSKAEPKPKPGDVVVSTKYGLDFGVLRVVPGDVGVVHEKAAADPGLFIVVWQSNYVCSVGPDDVTVVDADAVWRITGHGEQ